jgi:hypothetical protein
VDPDGTKLFNELRKAGLSGEAIRAAWPAWWSDEVAASPSGRTELRFALARKLGLAPKPLLGERVEFVWRDEAKFKYLSTESDDQKAALTSFGVSIGRMLLRATPPGIDISNLSATHLREAILEDRPFVDLQSLLAACWAFGIPVIHLRIFPLSAKSMHAMVVQADGRHAILLSRDAQYPAPIAFTLAHELGHIALRHLKGTRALIDLKDPAEGGHNDPEETDADGYGLTLLTASPEPDIRTNLDSFNAPTLAGAVLHAAPLYRIEPGTLALCLAYRQQLWPIGMAALRYVYAERKPVWREVNGIADAALSWDALGEDAADFLRAVMTGDDD